MTARYHRRSPRSSTKRIADADANPDDFMALDEFEREVRARRTA